MARRLQLSLRRNYQRRPIHGTAASVPPKVRPNHLVERKEKNLLEAPA